MTARRTPRCAGARCDTAAPSSARRRCRRC
jgi:hypothetical protein